MSSEPISTPHRVRVNGAFLQTFHNKPVCLLGMISKADGGGTAFQVKSSDNQTINIRLKTPISEPLTGLIEVYGIGQGKNLILADSFTTFPEAISSTFDMATYNKAVNMLQTLEGKERNPWIPC